MKARHVALAAIVALGVCTAIPAHAQSVQSCSFNGGERIRVRVFDLADGFRIEWADGPKMSYTNLHVGGDTRKYVDRLGGEWWWNSHRDGIGFNLYNSDNQNEIRCY